MSDALETARPGVLRRTATLLATTAMIGAAAGLVVLGTGQIAARAERPPATAEIAPLPVAVARVARRTAYEVTSRHAGRVEARHAVALGFEPGGTVAEVLVEEGDRVADGTVVARLDMRGLTAERDALVASRDALAAQADLARLTAERQRRLLDRDHVSAQRYDDARLTLARLEAELRRVAAGIEAVDVALSKSELRAPFAGLVGARFVDPGTAIAPGQPVVRLFESGRPLFRAGLPAALAEGLAPGDEALIELADRTLAARVTAVRDDVDPATRTVSVLFEPESDGHLTEGTLGHVALARSVPGDGAWVPATALSEGVRGLWTVFTIDDTGDGLVARREAVELVHADGPRAFVQGALPDGALIVAGGSHRVADGQPVLIADPE